MSVVINPTTLVKQYTETIKLMQKTSKLGEE